MKKIKNEIEYDAIMARIDELVEIVGEDTPQTDRSYIELDILTDLVVAYEEEHFPVNEPSLVDVIKLRMYEMNLTQKSVAEMLGVSPSRVSEILSGKSEPTLPVARTISQKLNINASIVLGV
ncbi:helix-turn-helix domain-containing protein [Massilibacteroides sp.]|uniref:helix-turn-helix domain-containing protein n=1 Tax=Massilibacteroides sp. TaxID=2034766 RepID=UPI00262E66A0|nr:helix-turn-helix domain-containing protein [Massilibacteroides sp.]MDD4514833.1 helix-turn-helix domain-containing protein [Massilibacteroides sp.]